ncbi:MAG: hypothetical protein IT304_03020 [Dehalococcoidia bacterium]|nr:hypothetical protein [Dehalococcoidia bacterium]
MARKTPLLVAAMLFAAGSAGLALTVPGEHAFGPLASFTLRDSPPPTAPPLVVAAPGSLEIMPGVTPLPATPTPESPAPELPPALVTSGPSLDAASPSPVRLPSAVSDEDVADTPTPAPVRAAMVQRDSEPPAPTPPVPPLRIPGVANGEPTTPTPTAASITTTATPTTPSNGPSRPRQP